MIYDQSRIDEDLVRHGVERLGAFHADAEVIVITDTPAAMAPIPGWPVHCFENAEQVESIVTRSNSPRHIFFLIFDSDENALTAVRVVKQRRARWFPIKKGVLARYWHLHDQVRAVLRDELADQQAAGFSKWDDGDFTNLIQAIDITRDLDGAFVEIGAFRGSSGSLALRYMKETALRRDCYFLDVFEGFEYEAARTSPDAAWAGTHKTEGRDVVEGRLKRHEDIDHGPRVTVVQANIISDPLPAGTERIALANIDVDMYEAVLAALERVGPRLVPGGLMVVEDPGHTPHLIGARLALEEFMERDGGSRYRRIHMESGQTLVFRKDTVASPRRSVSVARGSTSAAAPTVPHAVVCGAVRNPEELRYIIGRLSDWRNQGRLGGIVLSTWRGELDAHPVLARDLRRGGVTIVEGREVRDPGLRNLWRQQRSLEQGLGAVPPGARVLKLRTDKCARRLTRFAERLERAPAPISGTSPGIGLFDRLVLSRASATIPGLIDDTAFLGARDDVARLCHYDAAAGARWQAPVSCGANLLWIGPMLARSMPVFDSFYTRYDAAAVSAALLALGQYRQFPAGLRRLYIAWWTFLADCTTLAATDPDAASASLAAVFSGTATAGRLDDKSRSPVPQRVIEGDGIAAALLDDARQDPVWRNTIAMQDTTALRETELCEIDALLERAGAARHAVPTTTLAPDESAAPFPCGLLETATADEPWADAVETALRNGLDRDRPLAAILFALVDELRREGYLDQAEICLTRAAGLKHPEAILERGKHLIESGSAEEGLRMLLWNIEKKHEPSLLWLADQLESGTSLPHDPERAATLRHLASSAR